VYGMMTIDSRVEAIWTPGGLPQTTRVRQDTDTDCKGPDERRMEETSTGPGAEEGFCGVCEVFATAPLR
jgi:hypothetical protein